MNGGDSTFSGYRFDTTNACSSTRFRDDAEQTNITSAAGVSTATQLGGEIAHAQHAYTLIILLAEQRHRTFRFRRFEIHDVGFDRQIATNLCVHQVFDRTNLFWFHRFVV